MTRIRSLKSHIIPLIVIFVLSLNFLFRLRGYLYSIWDLTIPPFSPLLEAKKFFYVWDPSFVGGRYYVLLFNAPLMLMYHALSKVMSVGLAFTLVHWFLYFLSGVNMYIFSSYLHREKKYKIIGALFSAFLYLYNPFWIFRQNVTFYTIYILAFLPLLLMFLSEAITRSGWSRKFQYVLLSVFTTILMYPGLANLPVAFATFLLISSYIAFYGYKLRKFGSTLVIGAVYAFLVLLTNAWWVLPNFWHSAVAESVTRTGEYMADTTESVAWWVDTGYVNYDTVLRNTSYYTGISGEEISKGTIWVPTTDNYDKKATIILSTSLILVISLLIFSRKDKNWPVGIEAIFFTFLILIPLFVMLQGPFKDVVKFLVSSVPLYPLRRTPSYMFLISTIYAILFGSSITLGLGHLSSSIKSFYKRYLMLISFVFLPLAVVIMSSFAQFRGFPTYINFRDERKGVVTVSSRVRVPEYASNAVEFLNAQENDGGVLSLPRGGLLRSYDWDDGYFGWDYYYLTLKRPVLSHAIDRYKMYTLYKSVEDLIADDADNKKIANLLKAMGVRYVMVNEDFIRHNDVGPFNFRKINLALSENPYLKLVFEDQKVKIFENLLFSEFKSLYIPAKVIGIADYEQNADLLVRNSEHISVYEDYVSKDLIKSDVPLASYTDLSVEKVSPAEYIIKIKGVTPGSLYMGSRITYNQAWQASINGENLPHHIINGIYNGWMYNNETISDEIVVSISFKYQHMVEQFILISVWSTVICVFLLLTISRSKKHLIVSLSGMDGSGKSTQVTRLQDFLSDQGLTFENIHVFSNSSTVMSKVHEKKQFKNFIKNIRGLKKNTSAKAVLFILRVLNLLIDSYVTTVKYRLKSNKDIVVFDRYFYDVLAVIMFDYPKMRPLLNLLSRCIVKPDISLFILVQADTAVARKDELSLKEAQNYEKVYQGLCLAVSGICIDGSHPEDSVWREIESVLRSELKEYGKL